MTYKLKRKKQYWIEVWQGRRKVACLARGGGYKWYIVTPDYDAKVMVRRYDNLKECVVALEKYLKRNPKKKA